MITDSSQAADETTAASDSTQKSIQQANDWLADFPNPPASFRLVPFWSWNEEMEPEEIERQVKIIKEGGWGGAFVHSRIGLITEYLGDKWFEAVDATIAACERENLIVWLYDEDKWPSGYSGGHVPLLDERFRDKTLLARGIDEPAPENCIPVGEPAHGLQVYQWTAPLGDPWFNGTSSVDRGSKDAMKAFLDHAYESYYERYSKHYGDLIKAQFTDEPSTIFRIACPKGSVVHSEKAFERFEAMHGYNPIEHLTLLFIEDAKGEQFRLHWHRTINDLFENNYSRQLGSWCAEHGIALTGHYLCEHGVYAQQNWGVKIMPNYRHQQIPGIDHLGRQIDERITGKQCQSVVNQFGKKRMLSELYGVAGGGLTFADRKWIALQQICLGVNLLNPHLSLYTMSGCRKRDFPQNIFYQQPWWKLNHLLDDSLARLCLTMSQGQYRARILLLHPQESAQSLWQTRTQDFDKDITGPYEGQDWNSPTPEAEKKVKAIEAQFFYCINALLGSQRSFDLGDETIIKDSAKICEAAGRVQFQIEAMQYDLVIVPSMDTMAPDTFQLLKAFAGKGGKVVVCGQAPTKIDGIESDDLKTWLRGLPVIENDHFEASIQEAVTPTVQIEPGYSGDRSMLWTHPRNLEDGSRISFWTNLSRTETFKGVLSIAGTWKAIYRLDERTGETLQIQPISTANGLTQLDLNLHPCECCVFLLASEGGSYALAGAQLSGKATHGAAIATQTINTWAIERMDDNTITLDYAAWKRGDEDWSQGSVPVIELQNSLNKLKYDGPLSLRYTFEIDDLAANRSLRLVLEHPERCQILLNGQAIEYAGLPYWRDIRWMPIDITGKCVAGTNEITLNYKQFEYGDLAVVEPAERRYGTEIESLYLVGDFSVNGTLTGTAPFQPKFEQWKVPTIPVDTLKRAAISIGEPKLLQVGDVTSQGLPFYAGRIALRCELPEMDIAKGERIELEFESLEGAIASISVNDKTIDYVDSLPYRVDLTETYLAQQPGNKRELTLVVYSTLRNLLGPHHHQDGELIEVGPEHFSSSHLRQINNSYDSLVQWSQGQWTPNDWREDYCLIKFGNIGQAHISKYL